MAFIKWKNDIWCVEVYRYLNFKTWKHETVVDLSEEQKKLSPWGLMNDTLIIELLKTGWRLENLTLDNDVFLGIIFIK